MALEPQHPIVRLVSAPEPDAETRFDFNDGICYPDADSFTIGAPQLIGDVGAVNGEYGSAIHSFNIKIGATEFEALALQAQLGRELMRAENYLLFQLSESTPPMWWRIVRSSQQGVSLATVYRDNEEQDWRLSVSLVSDPWEPFGIGEQQRDAVTIGNDPATGGMFATLPEVKGDAPAPLNVYDASVLDHSFGLVAVSRSAPIVSSTSEIVQPSGSDASLSGGDYSTVTLTETPATAFQWTPTLSAEQLRDVAAAPRRRLFGFFKRGSGSSGFVLRAKVIGTRPNARVTIPDSWTGARLMVDLGSVTLSQQADGYTLAAPLPQIKVTGSTTSGTQNLWLDCLVLLREDCIGTWGGAGGQGVVEPLLIHSEGEYVAWASGGPDEDSLAIVPTEETQRFIGGFPEVVPGETNVLTWQTGVDLGVRGLTAGYVPLANSSDLTVSSRSRHSWLSGP